MIRKTLVVLLTLLASEAFSNDDLPRFSIDPDHITVSGISAGAIMAHQLHIAFPEVFSGAGLIAPAPWNCADGSLSTAFSRCMASVGPGLDADEFSTMARAASTEGEVGDLQLLADDKVWIFHGSADAVVAEPVSSVVFEFYQTLIPADQVKYVNDVPAAHHFPTANNGHACDASETPWIGACGLDAAGEILAFIYPELIPPAAESDFRLVSTSMDGAGLSEEAFIFAPPSCRQEGSGCAMHLVLHGCGQSFEQIGDVFMRQSGYLRWAAENRIILAFPQVSPSAVNPLACWDWWGYSGTDYLQRNGAQMRAITSWLHSLAD